MPVISARLDDMRWVAEAQAYHSDFVELAVPTPTLDHVGDAREADEDARRRVRRHFDRLARERTSVQERHRSYYDELYRLIRDQVEPGARVLDLGCGDGTLLASLRPSMGVGVDLSMQMVKKARRRHPQLRFVCGDVERWPVRWTFDYVISSSDGVCLHDL